MDAIKHSPELSYFEKFIFYFPASGMSLEYFHLNEHVSCLWASMVVTRDNAVTYTLEAEEGM